MKKVFFLSIFLLSPIFSFSQSVTSIEAIQDSLDKIRLRWKSTVANGEFSLYYNKELINEKQKLFDSELIINSNFSGIDVGGTYQYEYVFSPKKQGEYFFAISFIKKNQINQQSRLAFDKLIVTQEDALIPEINITLQPINVNYIQHHSRHNKEIQQHTIDIPLLTSLELQSAEDVFYLRWNVFPKDRSQYIFIVYRSRYPIVQYGTPQGLPEYARITNQFSFEDRNIGFGIPYYYAVVAEKSTQWDSGINVFSQPAILLRKSPPFTIKPTIEYVKKQETLSLHIEKFSEDAIEQAVQQTLSNLHLIAGIGIQTQQRSLTDILAPTLINSMSDSPKGLTNLTETPISLQQQISTIKLDNFDKSGTQNNQRDVFYNSFVSKLDQHKKSFMKKEYENINNIMKINTEISEKIRQLELIEGQLLQTDNIPIKDLMVNLNEYYNLKDQITLIRHRVQGMIRDIKTREKTFLSEQKTLKTQFLKDIRDFEITLNENNKKTLIRTIDDQIDNISKNIKQFEQYLSDKKLKSLTKDIILQASKADATRDISSLVNESGTNDQSEKLVKIRIAKDKLQIKELYNTKRITMTNKTDLSSLQQMDLTNKAQNIDGIINNNVEEVSSYYKDVSVEAIPNIKDIKNEKWITVKEVWLQQNRNLWDSKKNLWKRRIEEILGEDYGWISSKWMIPSKNLALQEGRKAFQQKNYKESLYLLYFVSSDHNAMMALGQSYYYLGAYRDAFTVFITALHMGIPDSRYWMDRTAKQILNRKL